MESRNRPGSGSTPEGGALRCRACCGPHDVPCVQHAGPVLTGTGTAADPFVIGGKPTAPRTRCPGGVHELPSYALGVLEPLAEMPQLAAALGAWLARCAECCARHEREARAQPWLVEQALSLSLAYAAVGLNELNEEPGRDGEALLRQEVPRTVGEVLSAQTLGVLRQLPVGRTHAPDGHVAAVWERHRLADLLAALDARGLVQVWREATGMLVGFIGPFGDTRGNDSREGR